LDITAFIKELLFGHDCVIVPGFGAFLGNYKPAWIDNNSSTFFPPVKQISFNRNLTHNDGLLVGRISGSQKLNYSEARNSVDDFVNDIKARLIRGEKVVFVNIGTFVNDSEGNLQFEPDRDANYHLDSYGLTAFQVSPVEKYNVREKVLKFKDKEPVRQVSFRKNLWRAAVIIPLVAAMIAIPLTTDIFKNKVQRTSLNPLANIEFENNKQAVDNIKPSDSLLIQTPGIGNEKPVLVEPDVKAVQEKPIQPTLPYCIIAGSFKSETNASVLMKKLEAAGYTPELLNGPNGFFRVSLMRFSGAGEAERVKESLSEKYPESWVTRVK
jgi:nucleoid DNA-binding protein